MKRTLTISKPQKHSFRGCCTEKKAIIQRKTFKSLNLSSKDWNASKISLNEDGAIQFEARENAFSRNSTKNSSEKVTNCTE